MVLQLKQGITPEKIALTIAVGSALANFPFVGTMWLCLLAGVLLKLNQPIIQAVNVLFTPLHLFLIPNFFYWGNKLFGAPHTRLGMRNPVEFIEQMWRLLLHDPAAFAHRFGLLIFHATVVWAVIAPLWIALIYYSARTTLREIARVRAEAAARAALAATAPKLIDPADHPVP